MFTSIKNHNLMLKAAAAALLLFFSACQVSQAAPHPVNTLQVQSVSKPITSMTISDKGIARYYIRCLAKVLPYLEGAPGDLRTKVKGRGIDVKIGVKSAGTAEYSALVKDPEKQKMVPCTIGGNKYMAYVVFGEDPHMPSISVYTYDEFESERTPGGIFHGKAGFLGRGLRFGNGLITFYYRNRVNAREAAERIAVLLHKTDNRRIKIGNKTYTIEIIPDKSVPAPSAWYMIRGDKIVIMADVPREVVDILAEEGFDEEEAVRLFSAVQAAHEVASIIYAKETEGKNDKKVNSQESLRAHTFGGMVAKELAGRIPVGAGVRARINMVIQKSRAALHNATANERPLGYSFGPLKGITRVRRGDFDYVSEVDRGGMTNVYMVILDGKPRVLKTIDPSQISTKAVFQPSGSLKVIDTENYDKLLSEAEILNRINGRGDIGSLPYVAALLEDEYGRIKGIVLDEFSPGVRLRDRIRTLGALSREECLKTAIKVAEILKKHVHSRGIIHRDVKPQNIYLTEKGDIILYDFNAAAPVDYDWAKDPRRILGRHTQFMAPWDIQKKTARPGYSDDAFGLGATIYYMLTGEYLSEEYLANGGEPEGLDTVDPRLKRIILKATDSKRGKRYSRIRHMLRDLQKLNRQINREALSRQEAVYEDPETGAMVLLKAKETARMRKAFAGGKPLPRKIRKKIEKAVSEKRKEIRDARSGPVSGEHSDRIQQMPAWDRLKGIAGMLPSYARVREDATGAMTSRQRHVLRGLDIALGYAGSHGFQEESEGIKNVAYTHELGRMPFAHYVEKRVKKYFTAYEEASVEAVVGTEKRTRFNQPLAQAEVYRAGGIDLPDDIREDIENMILKRGDLIKTVPASIFYLADTLLGYVEDFVLTYKITRNGRSLVEDFRGRDEFIKFIFGVDDGGIDRFKEDLDALEAADCDEFIIRRTLELMERVVDPDALEIAAPSLRRLQAYRDRFEEALFPAVDGLIRLDRTIEPVFEEAVRVLKREKPDGMTEREKEKEVFKELLQMTEQDLIELSGSDLSDLQLSFSWKGAGADDQQPGPALYVDPYDNEVRGLFLDEHRELNSALRRLVFEAKDHSGKTFMEKLLRKRKTPTVKVLRDETASKLIGRGVFQSLDSKETPVKIYIIDDKALCDSLPEEYRYLAKGLISHVGTHRRRKIKGAPHRAHNLYIPRSVYLTLIGLPDLSPLYQFWISHEVEHFVYRDSDIDGRTLEIQKEMARQLLTARDSKNPQVGVEIPEERQEPKELDPSKQETKKFKKAEPGKILEKSYDALTDAVVIKIPPDEKVTKPPDRKNELKKRAEKSVKELAAVLFNLAINAEEGEKVLFALDEDLGNEGAASMVKQVIRRICETCGDEEIQKRLGNIIFIKGSGEALAGTVNEYISTGKDGVKIKPSNVIMLTSYSNRYNCMEFFGQAVITFVDDAKLDIMDYYPIVELALFTVAKALYHQGIEGFGADKLMELYRDTNAEPLSGENIIERYIDQKAATLILKPAEPYTYEELRDIYRSIQRFLKAA